MGADKIAQVTVCKLWFSFLLLLMFLVLFNYSCPNFPPWFSTDLPSGERDRGNGFHRWYICRGVSRTPDTRGSKKVGQDLGGGNTTLLPGLVHRWRKEKAGNSKAESYKGPTIPGDIEEEKAREEANCLITYFMNTLIISSFTTGCPTYTNCFPQKNNIENKWASGN